MLTSPLRAEMPCEDVVEVPAISEELCVSNLFQTNMVLQRDKPISIWGWAAPGEQLTVIFGGDTRTTTAGDDRSWKVTFAAMSANAAPQRMTVKGADQTLTIENILLGDVWVLGGQSNMEFPLQTPSGFPLTTICVKGVDSRVAISADEVADGA